MAARILTRCRRWGETRSEPTSEKFATFCAEAGSSGLSNETNRYFFWPTPPYRATCVMAGPAVDTCSMVPLAVDEPPPENSAVNVWAPDEIVPMNSDATPLVTGTVPSSEDPS